MLQILSPVSFVLLIAFVFVRFYLFFVIFITTIHHYRVIIL